jgi:hypothetical protein
VNEIKHDGFRVIAWKNGKRIKLYSLGQGPRLPLPAETTEQPANAPPWQGFSLERLPKRNSLINSGTRRND